MGNLVAAPLQDADPDAATGSWAAPDATTEAMWGNGVISGLAVTASYVSPTNGGHVSAGRALLGHVVSVPANVTISGSGVGVGSWDVYLVETAYAYSGSSAVPGTYPDSTGQDSGAIEYLVAGTTPAFSTPYAMLATITINSSNQITAVNNQPTGRVQLGIQTVTVASDTLTLTNGAFVAVACDFSGVGSFADKSFRALLSTATSGAEIYAIEDTNAKTAGKCSFLVWLQTASTTTSVALALMLIGKGWNGATSSGITGSWSGPTALA